MTCRQVFYRLVALGAVGKTEPEYKSTVCRLLTEMRLDGSIPFHWIADNTRWMRKPITHGDLNEYVGEMAALYRRNLWDNQDATVEVWLEKDALAGVLYPITGAWHVPLMVTRGYPSLSFVYDAAQVIQATGRPTHLYYLGDYDPSGLDIPRSTEARLREFAPDADITFERIAVTPAQIETYGLLTRPTKQTDSRARGFAGESVEVDALPPTVLRELVDEAITWHLDAAAVVRTRAIEALERDSLLAMADTMRGNA